MKDTLRYGIISCLLGFCLTTIPEAGLAVDIVPAVKTQAVTEIHTTTSVQRPHTANLGDKVPVQATTLDSDKTVCLTNHNKPAIVLYWQTLTSSRALKAQVQYLDNLYKKYHDQINFYTLVPKEENTDVVQRYIEACNISIPTVRGESIVYSYTFPSILLIDSQGYLRTRLMGKVSNITSETLIKDMFAEPLPSDELQRKKEVGNQNTHARLKEIELNLFPSLNAGVPDLVAANKSGIMSLSGAISDRPELMQAVRLGYLELSNGSPEESVRQYSKAIAIEPDNGLLYSLRSKAYTAMGKRELAEKDIQQAYILQPNNESAIREAYKIDLQCGRYIDAAEKLKRIAEKSQKASIIERRTEAFLIGKLYIKGGQVENGLAYYRAFQQKDENPIRGNADYGMLLSLAGCYAESNIYLDKVLQQLTLQDPNSSFPWFISKIYKEKAWNNWKLRKNADALANIQESIAMHKGTDLYALKAAIERDMDLSRTAIEDEAIAYDTNPTVHASYAMGSSRWKTVKVPGTSYTYSIPGSLVIANNPEKIGKGHVFLAGDPATMFVSGVVVQPLASYSYMPNTLVRLGEAQKKEIAEGLRRDILSKVQTAKNIHVDFLIQRGVDCIVLDFDDQISHNKSFIYVKDGQYISFDYGYPIAVADRVDSAIMGFSSAINLSGAVPKSAVHP